MVIEPLLPGKESPVKLFDRCNTKVLRNKVLLEKPPEPFDLILGSSLVSVFEFYPQESSIVLVVSLPSVSSILRPFILEHRLGKSVVA